METIYICPHTGQATTPRAVERRGPVVWWRCSSCVHFYHGVREYEWHVIRPTLAPRQAALAAAQTLVAADDPRKALLAERRFAWALTQLEAA